MSKLAACYVDVMGNFSVSVLNGILDALDGMQERTFRDDVVIELDRLCALEKALLEKQARLNDLINKLTTAITNLDIVLANRFCPDLTGLSTCMKDYREDLEEIRDGLQIGDLQARIIVLQGRESGMERCGFAATKFRQSIENQVGIP